MINSFHCLFNSREDRKLKSHNYTASIRVSLNIFVVLKEQYGVCQGLERLLGGPLRTGKTVDAPLHIFREVVEKVEIVLFSSFKSTG